MATPNDMPTDALRLARLNLRTRLHRVASRQSTVYRDKQATGFASANPVTGQDGKEYTPGRRNPRRHQLGKEHPPMTNNNSNKPPLATGITTAPKVREDQS